MNTYDEVMAKVLAVFPNATMDQDIDGQLIVYTDLVMDGNSNVRPMTDEDTEERITVR